MTQSWGGGAWDDGDALDGTGDEGGADHEGDGGAAAGASSSVVQPLTVRSTATAATARLRFIDGHASQSAAVRACEVWGDLV